MSTDQRNWTEAQRKAIKAGTGSLLVSAAAGSGKTTVLAERCVHLVCDAADRCEIDQLLVVTFTNSAATEMRARIQAALAERMAVEPSPYLARQLALVEHAAIGTIHGFCNRLLRENFSEANIDPQFRVLDADEALLLRRDAARELFADRYERDADGSFADFVDAYGDGRDQPVIEIVQKTHALLASIESPKRWRAEAFKYLAEAAQTPLTESKMGKRLLSKVAAALKRLRAFCAAARARIQSLGGFDEYAKRVHEWEVTVSDWEAFFVKHGLDALRRDVFAFETPAAPRYRDDLPNKKQAKALFDAARKQIKDGELKDLLAFTADQWRAGQEAILPHARVLLELVDEFNHRYAGAKAAVNGLDFSDLERMTLNLLRDANDGVTPVARRCHEEFRHVLVDEYQDVNPIQDAILKLLSTECVATDGAYPPNLFTVGDVKQSIFRFRLAEPRRFLERSKKLPPGGVIHLQENFRSRPVILDAINNVFRLLMTEEATGIEYDQTHWLNPPNKDPQPPGPPPLELHLLPEISDDQADDEDDDSPDRTEREATLCALEIKKIAADKFGDVAILLRAVKFKSEIYARVLRRHGIPVHHTGGAGFFDAQEIRDILALLSVLDNQRQDIPLAAVLRSPLANLDRPEDVLARVRLAYPLDDDGKTPPFHLGVVRYATEQTDETAEYLRGVLEKLARWRDLARQRPLAELIWHIYDQTDCLAYAAALEDGDQRVANLLHLYRLARQFGEFLQQGLHRFMSFLSELREEAGLEQPSIAVNDRQSVRIMSIHKAKGLEFPIVLLPDLGKRFNLIDTGGSVLLDRQMGLAMKVVDLQRQIRYPSMSWALMRQELRRQTLAEEMRLLYVALTRAKERMILIGTGSANAPEEWAQKFAGHRGPLAAEEILSAASMLDWLGPVQAACGPATCTLIPHSVDEVQGWNAGAKERVSHNEQRLSDFARLAPPQSPAALTPEAAAVISRLEFVYPHQPVTTVKAASAATAIGGVHFTAPVESELAPPAFLSDRGGLSPTQIGEATHLVLQRLDYRRPCDAADVAAQISELVDQQLLTAAQASAVDATSIVWLAGTPLGQMLKANADRLMREIPFAASVSSLKSDDPQDAVMVRGRIDLLLPVDDGVEIVDYKTDRVTADTVAQRAESYQSQMTVYRDALRTVAGKEVKAVHLVFLAPRIVCSR